MAQFSPVDETTQHWYCVYCCYLLQVAPQSSLVGHLVDSTNPSHLRGINSCGTVQSKLKTAVDWQLHFCCRIDLSQILWFCCTKIYNRKNKREKSSRGNAISLYCQFRPPPPSPVFCLINSVPSSCSPWSPKQRQANWVSRLGHKKQTKNNPLPLNCNWKQSRELITYR